MDKTCKTCKHANESVTKCIPEDDAITPDDWCRMYRTASDEVILMRLSGDFLNGDFAA